jgi:hypothetical protein
MSSNANVPGLKLPTQKAMLAGTPRDSAIQSNTNMNQKSASLSAAVGGSRRMKKNKSSRKRKGGAIAVPQFQMQYSDQSGPGGSPNNQVQQNSQISTQQVANATFDSEATKKGGYRNRNRNRKTRKLNSRRRKGGNTKSDWNWGCYSGGKKSKKHKKNNH